MLMQEINSPEDSEKWKVVKIGGGIDMCSVNRRFPMWIAIQVEQTS